MTHDLPEGNILQPVVGLFLREVMINRWNTDGAWTGGWSFLGFLGLFGDYKNI